MILNWVEMKENGLSVLALCGASGHRTIPPGEARGPPRSSPTPVCFGETVLEA